MTEKIYGGASNIPTPKQIPKNKNAQIKIENSLETLKEKEYIFNEDESVSNLIKAGEIAKKVKEYAKQIIKPQSSLKEIADKIEEKIIELGGKPAFPTNLSINEIAAHDTPSFNDDRTAEGLLKVDVGVQIEGCIADTAFSLDLENSGENKNLIRAAEAALEKAKEIISLKITLSEIGKAIETEITKHNSQPIRNLSGHSLSQYELHSGITIPNHDSAQKIEIEEGAYAIEPFTTLSSGGGAVRDGKPSGIYILENSMTNVRDPFAREVLQFIKKEYLTLPFCSRWLVKKFSTRALIALKRIEEAKIIRQYPQLIEKSGAKVAQAEDTVVLTKNKKIVTT